MVQTNSIPRCGDVGGSPTLALPLLMDHRYPTLSPLAFEMFYDMSALRGLPISRQPARFRLSGGRVCKGSRDLMVRLEIIDGHLDGITAMLVSSKIKARTLARHFKHLRMMQHLLGLMGHRVEFVAPQAQAFMQRRARIMMHKAGLLRSAS